MKKWIIIEKYEGYNGICERYSEFKTKKEATNYANRMFEKAKRIELLSKEKGVSEKHEMWLKCAPVKGYEEEWEK